MKDVLRGDALRKAIADCAAVHGFELAHADLRSSLFFLRRGHEVRRGFIWRNIETSNIAGAVDSAIEYGDRIDRIKGSRFYFEDSAA